MEDTNKLKGEIETSIDRAETLDTLEDIRGMWRTGDPDRVELVHVYGVIGGIARRWASTFANGATNPFKKQQAGARDVYVLNSTLANELGAVIQESGSTMGDLIQNN